MEMSTGHSLSVCLGFRTDFAVPVDQCTPSLPVPCNSLLVHFKLQLHLDYRVHVPCTMILKAQPLLYEDI